MNKEEAIGVLTYKVNMANNDVYIGDLDKTNIEAIKVVLQEIDKLNNIINELEKWLEENIKISKAHDNNLGVNVASIFLDKLKELKEEGNKE